jgi:hypothetical protein
MSNPSKDLTKFESLLKKYDQANYCHVTRKYIDFEGDNTPPRYIPLLKQLILAQAELLSYLKNEFDKFIPDSRFLRKQVSNYRSTVASIEGGDHCNNHLANALRKDVANLQPYLQDNS